MERVKGIGGLFFRSKDPSNLAAWYQEYLGISLIPKFPEDTPWIQEAGPTHFVPFDSNTDYFGRESQMWMVNFRVANLEAMVKQLQGSGIEVKVDTDDYPNGRFARLHDPEGNPIELWEPNN